MPDRIWGVSRIKDLRLCPRYYVSKYETKQWVEAPSPQMERGSRVHKLLENSILYDLALPPELACVNDFVSMLVQMKHNGVAVVPEFKFGLDRSFNRCDFFRAPGLRARCGLDVFVNDNGKLLVIDWKTGQYKPEHMDEARFYGAAAWMATKAKSCTAMYVYTDNPQCTFDIEIEKPEAIMTAAWTSYDKADHFLDSPSHSTGKLRVEDPPMNPGKYCGWCGDLNCPNNTNQKAKDYAAAQSGTIVLQDVFK